MASKKRKSTPSPFNSQAAAEALIRYNPELSGLKALQQDAESTYGQRVRAGSATSAALQQIIDAAVPDVRGAYNEGALGIKDVNALVHGDTAGLSGAGADRFKNAITSETANFANLLRGARANAVSDLSRRKVAAAEGAKFSADQAGSDLSAALEKIGLRRTDIAKESGAFQQQRVGELTSEQRQRQFTARENRRGRQATARENRRDRAASASNNAADNATSRGNALIGQGLAVDAQGNPVMGKNGKPKKLPGAAKKPKSAFSAESRRTASRTVRSALEALGAKYQLPKDPSKENKLAATYLLTENEGVKDTFLAEVAVARYFNGGVTAETNRRLKRQYGITVKLAPKAPSAQSLADKLNRLPPQTRTLPLG